MLEGLAVVGRTAFAALLGTTGALLVAQVPVKAADLGVDCCSDLEERVAELEATTVRKGDKKVSVTLYGQLIARLSGGMTTSSRMLIQWTTTLRLERFSQD